MSFSRTNLIRVVGVNSVAVVAIQSATAAVAIRRGRRDYADGAWGPGLAAVAGISAAVGRGDRSRRIGTAVVVSAWAARLTRQMVQRFAHSDSEDGRYTEFLQGDGTAAVLAKVFGTQAVGQLLVAAPVQLAAASPLPRGRRRLLVPLGLGIAVAGAVIEAVADAQKDAYSRQPRDSRPAVLDTGLWGWSRHPNYFGDSLVWDGIWLAGAASAPGALTVFAPVLMSYFLVYATGAKRTERIMQDRPGYAEYQRRVSLFVPLPPRA